LLNWVPAVTLMWWLKSMAHREH